MGVGLVRSLQPPDILWIHWRVYNSIANTSKGGTLLSPSDAYVRSFLYLVYTLIKLYYTHTHTHTHTHKIPPTLQGCCDYNQNFLSRVKGPAVSG